MCCVLVALSCGGVDPLEEKDAGVDLQTVKVDAVAEVIIGVACKTAADCTSESVCINATYCDAGVCKHTLAQVGSSCEEGCFVGGACSADGVCEGLELKECAEKDGNLCTVPECDSSLGECVETSIEDGGEPYASTDCFEGAVCIGGEQDNSDAAPTALALECELLGDEVDPFGCIAGFVCVGGEQGCKELYKEDGAECWKDDSEGGETCAGRSCLEGECVVDHAFDASCDEEDYPDECDAGCLQCTALECHWIPDPSNPENPSKKVRYCQPGATIGEACSEDPCTNGQVCAFGQSADGPLGKETLGVCAGGESKTKEQCAEELGKPALACLLAGLGCDAEEGGCYIEQSLADQWCWPPEWKCFDKNDTYCTHLDSGEMWDPENGCHTMWVDLDCDDSNGCTVDTCKSTGDEWLCEHQPVDGAACDDDDACTSGGMCEEGVCAGLTPLCVDGDDDPCNDPACDAETGECLPPATDGILCDDANACTVGDACFEGACASGDQLECDDGNACNGLELCDPASGCLSGEPLSCDDGNACNGVESCDAAEGCLVGQALVCSDGNACNGEETCDPGQGCISGVPLNCGDGNACNGVETCDVVEGCVSGQAPVCSDGNACNGEELCDPIQGCVPGVPLSCNDGNACNGVESCGALEGCLAGTPPDCDDGEICTNDSCSPDSGCFHQNNSIACDDGDASTVGDFCSGGKCTPGAPVDCDDGNVCTNDQDDPVVGCKYTNNQLPCDDFDACTEGDGCAGGQCVSGPDVDCDDGNFCTVDTCNALSGCGHTDAPDGTSCFGGLNYACVNGNCLCVPDCDGKDCGSDGCIGFCGICDDGQECVNGSCSGGGGFDPNGTYGLSPSVTYSCGEIFGSYLVSFNHQNFTFVDSGSELTVTPSMNGCCTMTGASAKDGDIWATCTCPGGGVCDETYQLIGSFTSDTTWEASMTASYSGQLCLGCSYKSWWVTGTK